MTRTVLLACMLVPCACSAAWFGPADVTSIPSGVFRLAVGDFSGDGFPDVAAGYTDLIRVYFADGTGGFDLGLEIPSPSAAMSVGMGDFNGDGFVDIASCDYQNGPQRIHYGDGWGGVLWTQTFESDQSAIQFLRVSDLDGDGFSDLIIPSIDPTAIGIAWGSSSGVIRDPAFHPFDVNPQCATTIPSDVDVADTDGDGNEDLVVVLRVEDYCAEQSSRGIARFRGLGARAFGVVEFLVMEDYETTGDHWYDIDSGDLDGDGDLDFVVAESAIHGDGFRSMLKSGPGTWEVQPGNGYYADGLVLGDFDGDSVLDVVCGASGLQGNGDGTFTLAASFDDWLSYPLASDLDSDGDLDVLSYIYGIGLYAWPGLSANHPSGVSEMASGPPVGGLVSPTVLHAGDLLHVSGFAGSAEIVDASGRIAMRVSAAGPPAGTAWAVPAELRSGRYWVCARGSILGSFVVID